MTIKQLVMDATLAALSIILYLVKFSLPIFPQFLEMNLSMLPIIIAVLLFRFRDASIIVVLRLVGKLIFMGTTTQYVGEIADIFLGLVVVIIMSLIKKKTTNPFILTGLIILSWTLGGVVSNLAINIPLYIKFMGITMDDLVNMCSIMPGINKDNFLLYYSLFAVVPFNLILSSCVGIVSILVYGRLKRIEKLQS